MWNNVDQCPALSLANLVTCFSRSSTSPVFKAALCFYSSSCKTEARMCGLRHVSQTHRNCTGRGRKTTCGCGLHCYTVDAPKLRTTALLPKGFESIQAPKALIPGLRSVVPYSNTVGHGDGEGMITTRASCASLAPSYLQAKQDQLPTRV